MPSKRQQKYASTHATPITDADDSKVSIERVPMAVKESMPRPQPSLAPGGEDFMIACADGVEWACSIRDAWGDSKLPYVTMDRVAFEKIVAKRSIVF